MRALVPSGSRGEWVTFDHVAEPEPRENEAVVQVAAVSVNRGETFVLERPQPGWRPGKDIAGTVIRSARNGAGPKVGDRVIGHPDGGGWAERVAVPVAKLATIPNGVAFEQAAALPLAGLTALRLVRAAKNLASRRVLLTGASGGVGHFFVELAAAQGAQITAVSRSQGRGARLRELGANEVVAQVQDTHGKFDVGLDSVGHSSTAAVLTRLVHDGLLIWFGQASRVPPELDFFDWQGGMNATIRKFHYGAEDDSADLATLARLVADGRLVPEIGLVASWDQAETAIVALLDRRVRGNVVLNLEGN